MRPFPFILSPVVRIHMQLGVSRALPDFMLLYLLDVVRNFSLYDPIVFSEYVPSFLLSLLMGRAANAKVALISVCSSTIFTVTYGFNASQIVRLV